MFKRALYLVLLTALVAGMLVVKPFQPVSAQAQMISPVAIINTDGTLNVENSLTGPVDLEGWNIQLDPQQGPVFTPNAPQEEWSSLGNAEGGPIKNTVNAIIVTGSDIYVGGDFMDAGNNRSADYVAKWDGSQWLALGNNGPQGDGAVGGTVYDMVMVGSDLYIGGDFNSVYDPSGNSIPNTEYLAKWNGTVWSAVQGLTTPLNHVVNVLAYDATNNDLYIGGGFTDANAIAAADRIAKLDLDTNTWSALGNNGMGDGSLNNWVNDIAVSSTGIVYAGGYFTDVRNGLTTIPEADYVASWSSGAWHALGGSGNGAINDIVTALKVDASNNLYVGGVFSDAAGVADADFIAKWNGSWSALGSTGDWFSSGCCGVKDILINGSDVYITGYFGITSIPEADHIAKFDTNTNTWSSLGSNGTSNGSLTNGGTSLARSGNTLYVGGEFSDVNNNGTVMKQADYFAAWDGTNWSTLGTATSGIHSSITSIAVIGSDIYIGGSFGYFGENTDIYYIAHWDGNSWSKLGSGLNNQVDSLEVQGTDLYVGGYFTDAGGVPEADYVAKWDGTQWSALGTGTGGNGALNGPVFAIKADGGKVYVGGDFTNISSNNVSLPTADYIAMFDTNSSNWSALGSDGNGNGSLGDTVLALEIVNSVLYVGGSFTNVNNNGSMINEADYIAKWSNNNWSAVGSTAALGSYVVALEAAGDDLYVGGQFLSAAGIATAKYLAKFNTVTETWSGLGAGTNSPISDTVRALKWEKGVLYVGGYFQNVLNNDVAIPEADYVAKFDGTNWSALGSNGNGDGSLDDVVFALAAYDDDLYVGGDFLNVNNNGTVISEADHLAAFGLPTIAPQVTALARADTNPTSAASVSFNLTFSENVTGVDTSDFLVTTTGSISGASVTNVSGSGTSYIVTVNTGNGSGNLRLDIIKGNGIVDSTGNKLLGIPYTSGESYDVLKNAAPTDITLSASSLAENLPSGTLVGTFASTDPDAGNTFTYTLVSGTGSDDNAAFSISGNQLLSAQAFNFINKNSYSIRVRSTDNGGLSFEKVFTISITDSASIFADVPSGYWAESFIERLYNAGITGGCSTNPLNYCPTSPVTRAQMAVFLEKGLHGAGFTPANVAATFTDTAGHWAEDWIEALKSDGVTSGCGAGIYCPENSVTRDQMAVFLLKAKYGSAYTPPAVGASTGFTDVPSDHWAAAWIKQLAAEAITGGCGSGLYCPSNAVTRDQMAVFLVRTFNLP